MIMIDEFEAVRRAVERRQREADKAAGAYEQLKTELLERFDCETVKQAERLLEELREKELETGRRETELLKAFKEEYAHLLGDDDDGN